MLITCALDSTCAWHIFSYVNSCGEPCQPVEPEFVAKYFGLLPFLFYNVIANVEMWLQLWNGWETFDTSGFWALKQMSLVMPIIIWALWQGLLTFVNLCIFAIEKPVNDKVLSAFLRLWNQLVKRKLFATTFPLWSTDMYSFFLELEIV